uniref:Nucleoprotein n=1 Tax=Riverside virus 1 TaxID=1803263 RepID=A0A140D051_9RHAB|nr:nucleoprotein [Riverside virus 1]
MAVNRPIKRISDHPELSPEVVHFDIGTDRPIGYPSAWFAQNVNDKPTIMMIPDASVTREQLHAAIRAGLLTGTVDHRFVVRFLYNEFNLVPGLLNSDWRSFGRNLGNRGERIGPSSIIVPREQESVPALVAGNGLMDDQEVLRCIILICSVYRAGPISRVDYRDQVLENVGNLLTPLGMDQDTDIGDIIDKCKQWIAYQPYVQMMATIDMFLNEFPFHPYSQARIGTIVTRFKDCAALIATRMITQCLGLKFPEFAEWIWTSRCADQFERIIKGDEEMDEPRSYSMYFMDLGLSSKSPYSASVNLDLHYFFHTLGVSAGLERSKRARVVGDPEVNNIISNAVVMHYVMGRFATLSQQFGVDGEGDELEDENNRPMPEGEPQEKDSSLWLAYIMKNKGKVPDYIVRKVATEWEQNPACRDGTIGKALYDKSGPLLLN